MGFLDAYKTKKALAVLLASQDPASPQTVQALARLKEVGRPALAKFVAVLGNAKHPEIIGELLATFLDNETFAFFVSHLTHPNAQVAIGIAKAFIKSTRYDPNRLLTLLTDAKTPKVALGRILTQRKDHLNVKSLINLLGPADRDSRAVLLRLIERSATEAMLPDLMRAARSKDATIRVNMARILARFSTEAVRDTLSSLLNDPRKEVRQIVLECLASLKMPLDLGLICQMLRDPDPVIQTKAKDILIQVHNPQTARALAELLQDEAEDVRQRAVEVLNTVHDSTPIRILLETLRGKEWWVKVRAFAALRTSGESKLFEAALTLLKDADEYIRSSAAEILKKDQRAFKYLVEMLDDTDPGVRARTVEALVTLEDRRAVPVFLRMLHEAPEMGALIIRSLAKLGDRQALPALVQCVQGTNRELRIAALRALPPLTDAAHAEQVWQAVMAARETADDDAELKEAANATANALVGKGVLVRPFTNSMILQPQPTLPDPRGPGALTILTPEPHEHNMEVIITDDHETSLYIDADTLEPGDMLIDRYRVIRRVGKGGFGAVVLVEDTVVGEEIILKFLNRDVAADDNMIERFKHELRYARRITHENVIRIHDFLTLKKSYAISMEYFPSHSLSDELKQGSIGLKRGLKIVWDICRGMSAAHQVGVVHRDLKPPNILLNDSGLVKVVDFGLAALSHADTRLTKTGVLLGTPTYMAPEQVRARTIDARTDIYSLGVIMYEIFTGRPPYVADDPMAILFQHVEGNPTPPRQLKLEIPPAVERIILKAMCVDPSKRFQSMDDLRKRYLRSVKTGSALMAERMSTNHAIHQIVVFGLSDQGLQRDNNEDHFMVADLTRKVIGVHENQLRPELFHHDIGMRGTVLMVADGLGGHEGGEIASQMAVDTVAQALVEAAEPILPISEQIIRAVDMAHDAICKYHGASGRTRHMASTLTAVHVGHGVMTVAQVGDSRAYRFSGGKLTLLTDDQTVVHMMQKKGMLTPEEAQNHPHRNIILQALGQDKSVLPEIQTLPFSHNDCLLLCSDGLSSYVAHEHIEEIMASGEDEHMLCRHLVEAANAAGGADNVTVLLARLIIKESVRPAVPSKPPVRSAPRAEEHAPTNIRPPEASVPRPAKTAPPPGDSPEAQAQRDSLTAPLRVPGSTRDASPPAAPNTAPAGPAKLPLWKREIKWPWGHKTTSPPTSRDPEPVSAEARAPAQDTGREEHAPVKPGNTASAAPWDPRVLKAVEDSLAEHIGPVAKILVGRAANQTKDLHELCQALAAQLSTEQERKSFLHNALRQQHTHTRRP